MKCGKLKVSHTSLFYFYQSKINLFIFLFTCKVLVFLPTIVNSADNIYQSPTKFLEEVFNGIVPDPEVLWFDAPVRKGIKEILDHDFPGIRVRYWRRDQKTAWILEEIGKYKPITVGFLINDGLIKKVKVLVYRESHGWEIKYPFFTNQFKDLRLNHNQSLSRDIDGISGATLSVNALTRLARLALYFHKISLDQ